MNYQVYKMDAACYLLPTTIKTGGEISETNKWNLEALKYHLYQHEYAFKISMDY